MAVHILFGGFFILLKDVSSAFHWLFEATYVKHSLDGMNSLILGYNRTKLNCHQIYCHFQSPQKFMQFIGQHENLPKAFYSLSATLIIIHIVTYFIMRYRLKN